MHWSYDSLYSQYKLFCEMILNNSGNVLQINCNGKKNPCKVSRFTNDFNPYPTVQYLLCSYLYLLTEPTERWNSIWKSRRNTLRIMLNNIKSLRSHSKYSDIIIQKQTTNQFHFKRAFFENKPRPVRVVQWCFRWLTMFGHQHLSLAKFTTLGIVLPFLQMTK